MQTRLAPDYEELHSHYSIHLSDFLTYNHVNDRYTDMIVLPNTIGSGVISRTRLRPGMEMLTANCLLNENHKILIPSLFPMVDLTFWIQGNIQLHHAGTHELIALGYGDLTFGQTQQLTMTYLKEEPIALYEIRLTPSVFDDLMEDLDLKHYSCTNILAGQLNRVFHHMLLPKVQSILLEIGSHSFVGPLRNMYLEGKTLELLALWFQQTLLEDEVPARRGRNRFSKQDIAKVREASVILEQRMEQPPSLLELSKLVKISDSKLKAGFKEIFGTTAFGFLKEKRLEKAKELLEWERISVYDAAIRVGYSNPSHFAASFRERFGCNPREWILKSQR